MRMSCNGCRVLRKGCSDNCSIRPCLQWIKTPESQANATVFLAKFYGRAGLVNLINAGPDHLRPEIFRSLLYEACGRIVNPTCGSVGLLWCGNWHLCQNAVEAVLNGAPITQIASYSVDTNNGPPFKAYDIRHIPRDENSSGSNNLHRVRTRNRFKRSPAKINSPRVSGESGNQSGLDSSLSHQSESLAVMNSNSDDVTVHPISMETIEALALLESEPKSADGGHEDGEIELELSLGFEPASRVGVNSKKDERCKIGCSFDDGDCKMELGLDFAAGRKS